MHASFSLSNPSRIARLAGCLYLVIIVAGIGSEVFLRAPLVVPGNPAETLAAISASLVAFRLSIAADAIMALADVGLAVLFFFLFRPVDAVMSLAAMTFRLVQAAILGMNLGNLLDVLAYADAGLPAEMAAIALQAHANGYDIGLIFFGINCILTGCLIVHSGFLPKPIGMLVAASGLVYLTGSALRILAPDMVATFQMAYVLPLVAEGSLALWLVLRGVDLRGWRAVAT